MHLIKTCPACARRLRFPLNKGAIKVKCACGYSFIADPDNTDIYRGATFDLTRSAPHIKGMTSLWRIIVNFDFGRMIAAFATGALTIKYRLQNFRLLPGAEKRKIAFVLLIIAACLAVLIVVICAMSQAPHTPDAMVI
ncbi:MAG: hypothetical protein E4G96_00860 [Chrysiogenales bacterium]|nr:MAG: hypothetical protein E4G96_00860 [Chrysiogenales bacterium]